MSRRRTRPVVDDGSGFDEEPQPAEERQGSDIVVGCTGRGTHRRITINRYRLDEDGAVRILSLQTRKTFVAAGANDQTPHMTVQSKCPACGRDMPRKEGRLAQDLRKLHAAGVTFLDLSALDAIG